MASNSGWTTGLPSGTSRVSDGAAEFRSLKSFVEAWFEDEHYATGGSDASAGVHRAGSARAFSQSTAPTATRPAGQLWHNTDNDEFFVHDGISWVTVSSNVQLSSQQTWTALQEFSSGVETSNLSLNGIFSGWTSYSTLTNLASINSNSIRQWTATDGIAANVQPGDFLVAHMSEREAFGYFHAYPGSGSISLNLVNLGITPLEPSEQTYTVFIYRGAHL